jgi:peptide/nickel transport system substrate-binding protein
MKKLFTFLLAVALTLPLAASPGQEPGTGTSAEVLAEYARADRSETFLLAQGYAFETTNMNPYIPTQSHGALWQTAPLFTQNQGTGEIMPVLALSYSSNSDFSEWTVKLRDDAYWSDGTPWNADDVMSHFDVIERFQETTYHTEYLQKIKELTKLNDYEVRFTLNDSDPYFHITFLSSGRYFAAAPARILDAIESIDTFTNRGDFNGEELPIIMGPFFLYRSAPNRNEYVRNDDWWAAKAGFLPLPAMKKFVEVYLGSRDVTLKAAIENDIDHIDKALRSEYLAVIDKNPSWQGFAPDNPGWEDMALRLLNWNMECPPPWNDKDMRKAIQLIIDKKTLAELTSGFYGPATSVFPGYPALAKYDALVDAADKRDLAIQNQERAAQILGSKGYTLSNGKWMKDGKQLSLTIFSPEYPSAFATGEIVTEQLIRFGIDATNRKMAGGPWSEALFNGDFTVAPGWHFLGALYEPYSTLKRATIDYYAPVGERATVNIWRYHNQEYTNAVNRLAEISPDSDEALRLTKIALDYVFDDMFVIPLHKNYFIFLNNTTYWTNYSTADNRYCHPDFWSDWAMQISMLKPAN